MGEKYVRSYDQTTSSETLQTSDMWKPEEKRKPGTRYLKTFVSLLTKKTTRGQQALMVTCVFLSEELIFA